MNRVKNVAHPAAGDLRQLRPSCGAAVFGELVEKALDHHLGGCIDEALADGGECAADFHVAFIGDLCANCLPA